MSEQRSAPPGVRVAVVGASGAAGGDITAALGRSPLPVTGWRLFGSRGGPGGEVELRGRSVPIEALDEDGNVKEGYISEYLFFVQAFGLKTLPVPFGIYYFIEDALVRKLNNDYPDLDLAMPV